MNIIITLFSCILVMIFSMPIMFSVQIALSDNLRGCVNEKDGYRNRESVIGIGNRNRLLDSAKRWEDVLNFHIICCCMIRPVSQYGKCYLFPIKGTDRVVYFPILYIDRHKARSARKHKYPLFSLTGEEENNTSELHLTSIQFLSHSS